MFAVLLAAVLGQVQYPSDDVILQTAATARAADIAQMKLKLSAAKSQLKNAGRDKAKAAEAKKAIAFYEYHLAKPANPKDIPVSVRTDLKGVTIGEVLGFAPTVRAFVVDDIVRGEAIVFRCPLERMEFVVRGMDASEVAEGDVLTSLPNLVAGGTEKTDGVTARWVLFVFKGLADRQSAN